MLTSSPTLYECSLFEAKDLMWLVILSGLEGWRGERWAR